MRSSVRLQAIHLLLITIAGLLATTCPAADPAPSDPSLPVIAQYSEAANAFPTALIRGTLVEQDGCIRIRTAEDPRGHLLVWQPSHRIQRNGERVEIVDGSGQRIARVGETADLGGGEMPAANDLKAPIPPACTGPYWMVGQP